MNSVNFIKRTEQHPAQAPAPPGWKRCTSEVSLRNSIRLLSTCSSAELAEGLVASCGSLVLKLDKDTGCEHALPSTKNPCDINLKPVNLSVSDL
jgi:hypothetical protein